MTLTTFIMPEYHALCINSWCSKLIERSASIQSIDTVDKTGEWSNQTQISLTLSMKRLKQLSRSSNEQIERWADRAMRNRAMSRSSGNREGVPKSGSSNQKQSFIQKIKCIQESFVWLHASKSRYPWSRADFKESLQLCRNGKMSDLNKFFIISWKFPMTFFLVVD